MTRTHLEQAVDAPPEVVFRAVAEVEHLPDAHPDITAVEFLGEQRSGEGTRFRETRRFQGKEQVTELEITEQVDGRSVRMVSDAGGTIWDSCFVVHPDGAGSRLELTMEARAYRLLPRLLNPLIKGLIAKQMAKHLDHLREFCERRTAESG